MRGKTVFLCSISWHSLPVGTQSISLLMDPVRCVDAVPQIIISSPILHLQNWLGPSGERCFLPTGRKCHLIKPKKTIFSLMSPADQRTSDMEGVNWNSVQISRDVNIQDTFEDIQISWGALCLQRTASGRQWFPGTFYESKHWTLKNQDSKTSKVGKDFREYHG